MLRFACRALLCGRQDDQWVGRVDRTIWDTVDDDGARKGITNSQWQRIQNILYRELDDIIDNIDADDISDGEGDDKGGIDKSGGKDGCPETAGVAHRCFIPLLHAVV
jgi:hypothetical protein